jgi:hypothetical protein
MTCFICKNYTRRLLQSEPYFYHATSVIELSQRVASIAGRQTSRAEPTVAAVMNRLAWHPIEVNQLLSE